MTDHRERSGGSRRLAARTLLAVAVAGLMTLTACGSGQSSQSGSKSGGDEGGNLGTIKAVVTNLHDLTEPGIDVGIEYGSWEGSGLSVQKIVSEKATELLATGEADVTLGSPNRILGPIISKDLPAKVVGPSLSSWDQYMVVGTNGDYADAKSMDDLKGAKFGISSFGSAGMYSTLKVAEAEGWSKSDYKFVQVGGLDALLAALKQGSIDAFAWSAIPAFTAESKGYARVLGSVAPLVKPPAPMTVLVASDKTIESRPDALAAFCKGFYAAQAQLQDDPEATVKLFAGKWKVSTTDIVKKAVKDETPLLATRGSFSDQQIAGMTDTVQQSSESGSDITRAQVEDATVNCDSL